MAVERCPHSSGWLLLSLAFLTGTVAAQPITPGGVLDTLKRTPEVKPAAPPPKLETEPAIRPSTPPSTLAKTITVQQFEFAGNTLYSADELQPLVASYTGRPITLIELYDAADKVTEFYVRKGYTLASALVPAQKVTEGTVRLEVIEGRIGTVRYEGLKRYRESDVDFYLDTAEGRLYRAEDFEKKLRRVDNLPGLDVKARLQPGEAYGTSDVVVQAKETPIQGVAFVDNGGTQNIGVIRMGGQLTLNSPGRVGDQLTLVGLRSREGLLNYGSVAYSLPTGYEDSRLNLSYGYATFDVAGALAGVSGRNRVAKAEFLLPVLKTAADQFDFTAGVSDTRANTDFTGITFDQSEVTLAEISGNYTHTFPNRSAFQATGLLSSNFKGWDVTDKDSQPLKADLDIQQLTPLPWQQLQLLTRTRVVYSLEPLPDTQRFAVGGPDSVRGYAPSEARGDWGYLAQITLRRLFFSGPFVLAPRLFYDAGVVRQHNHAGPGGVRPDVSLASWGFGTDASYRNLNLKLDYAIPTSNVPVSDRKEDGRFYGTFSLAF